MSFSRRLSKGPSQSSIICVSGRQAEPARSVAALRRRPGGTRGPTAHVRALGNQPPRRVAVPGRSDAQNTSAWALRVYYSAHSSTRRRRQPRPATPPPPRRVLAALCGRASREAQRIRAGCRTCRSPAPTRSRGRARRRALCSPEGEGAAAAQYPHRTPTPPPTASIVFAFHSQWSVKNCVLRLSPVGSLPAQPARGVLAPPPLVVGPMFNVSRSTGRRRDAEIRHPDH